MLVPTFQKHNRQDVALIGKEYAKGTIDGYETSLKRTQTFLQRKYNSSDIDIRAIDHEFNMADDFYLRSKEL